MTKSQYKNFKILRTKKTFNTTFLEGESPPSITLTAVSKSFKRLQLRIIIIDPTKISQTRKLRSSYQMR